MRQTMKSCFKYVAGALAAMAFIQCASVQEVEPSHRAKGSFEVYASPGGNRDVQLRQRAV